MKLEFDNIQKYLTKCMKLHDEQAVRQLRRDIVNESGKVYLRTAKKNTPTGQKMEREVSEGTFELANAKATIINGKVVEQRKNGSGIRRKKRGKYYLINDSEKMRQKWDSRIVKDTLKEVKLEVFNSASYSLYVDVGHRQEVGRFVPILGKRLKKPFVKGLHITDKARFTVEQNKQKAYKRVLRRYMKRKLHE